MDRESRGGKLQLFSENLSGTENVQRAPSATLVFWPILIMRIAISTPYHTTHVGIFLELQEINYGNFESVF